MGKGWVGLILFFASLSATVDAAQVTVTEEDVKGFAKTCCSNLGIQKPGTIAFGKSEKLAAYNACTEEMTVLIREVTYPLMNKITETLGSNSNIEEVKQTVSTIKTELPCSNFQIATHVLNVVRLPETDRFEFIKKVFGYFEKQTSWCSAIQDSNTTAFSPEIKWLSYLLDKPKYYKTVFKAYATWSLKNDNFTQLDDLMAIFSFLEKRQIQDEEKMRLMFDSACYKQNKSAAKHDWNTNLSKAFSKIEENANFEDIGKFLKYGAKAFVSLKNVSSQLGWSFKEIFNEIVQCKHDSWILPIAEAMRGALDMGMKKTAFSKIVSEPSIGSDNKPQLLEFIGAMGFEDRQINVLSILRHHDYDDETVANFFINAFLFQRTDVTEHLKSTSNPAVHSITLSVTYNDDISLKNLSSLFKLATGSFKPRAFGDFLDSIHRQIKDDFDKVERTVKLCIQLNITDEKIWQTVKEINRDGCKLDLFWFLELSEEFSSKCINANRAIESFFKSPSLKYCDQNIVKGIAEYNSALTSELSRNEFENLYEAACNSRYSERLVTLINQAETEKKLLVNLVSELQAENH